jgi:type IV pilus biogenesis protein CpaD/CtpE
MPPPPKPQPPKRPPPQPPPDGPVVKGKALPEKPTQVLTEILKVAGLKSATVTSVTRPPADQARVMYDNLVTQGIAAQDKLYKAPGRQVIKVFAANPGKSRDEVIKLMTAKINEIGSSSVSKHISDTHYVFDIAPSSIVDREAFIKAVQANKSVSKFLKPPEDPAFHIEIPK